MDASLVFTRVALFVALISSFEIYGQTQDARSITMIVLSYFAALFWRDWRFKAYDFFGDLSQETLRRHRPSIFVFGQSIESRVPESVERDVLLDADLLSYRKQSFAAYWGVIGAIGACLFWRFGLMPYSWGVIVAFLMIFPLAFTTHYSQQVVPLFLSLISVMIALWRFEAPSKTLLVIYVLSAFATLALLQNIRLNFVSRIFGSSIWLQSVLKRSIVAGIGFFVLVYAVAKLLPEGAASSPETLAQPLTKSEGPELRDRAIRTVAKGLAKFESRQMPRGPAQPRKGESPSASHEPSRRNVDEQAGVDKPVGARAHGQGGAKPSHRPVDAAEIERLAKMQLPPDGGGKSSAEREPSLNASGGKDFDETMRPTRAGVNHSPEFSPPLPLAEELAKKSPEELAALQSQLSQEIAKAEDAMKQPAANESSPTKPLTPEQLETLASGKSLTPEQLRELQTQLAQQDPRELQAKLENLKALRANVERVSLAKTTSPANNENHASAQSPTSDQSHNQQPSANPSQSTSTSTSTSTSSPQRPAQPDDANDRVREIAKTLDEKLERIESVMPYLVFGLIGLVIGLWVVKHLRRPKAREVLLTLSQEEKKQLADELKDIRARRLSAQQEIIETYNVMMDVLTKVQLGRDAGVPARVHVSQLKKRLPKMGESLLTSTDCFDAALYGDVAIASAELTKFRKSAKTIFKQFDIAA